MIPAPEGFSDLRAYLDWQGINPDLLARCLDDYLNMPENQPLDVFEDGFFQAHQYREIIAHLRDLLPLRRTV